MQSAYVIGIGKSGIAAGRLLKSEGWQVTLADSNSSESLKQQQQDLEAEGLGVSLGDRFDVAAVETRHSEFLDLVVVSPGVPWDIPGLVRARELGLETIGEIELSWRYLKHRPWVGITGTNGKTTTTALIGAIFQTAGLVAPTCGNIGLPACEIALQALFSPPDRPYPDWVIAELSSYQIESSASVTPKIGIWTTFTPDHLSRHKTLENYYTIKAHLLRQSEMQVFNGDDPYLRQVGLEEWPHACWTSVEGKSGLLCSPDKGAYLDETGWVVALGDRILPANALRMQGQHNQQNLLMAVATARLAGIDPEAITQAISTFPGVPHRLEHICTWQGIEFINDSKATNYDAAQVGLASVASPAILIAGGEAKAGDDTAWLQTIQTRAAFVLLIGSAASAFAKRLQDVGYEQYEMVETMNRAIDRAIELAPSLSAQVVLLSPACASFDQYQNFEQRGDHFRQLCQEKLQG
ncbi:MAG: UDP-N-acetylmuramoyl-L-alanine--D-glutamate ligase [Leptolyngbyaceae cyanobacterium bins.59]|nr:UDP-N-acetylmuramoyl-L-alanine--D-glutamate ligase [Leptolyngbyaceae cyanobacterium bins.59]